MNEQDMRQELVSLGGGAHALAVQILGDSDEAADAVHDAFAKVLSRPAAFDKGRGQLRPWFLRVVRNHCLDLLRRRRSTKSEVDLLADPGLLPESMLEIEQRDARLRRALARLRDDQRQILVLRDYMDLSYGEIADVLQIAPGTVMSRLHRARMALREALNELEG